MTSPRHDTRRLVLCARLDCRLRYWFCLHDDPELTHPAAWPRASTAAELPAAVTDLLSHRSAARCVGLRGRGVPRRSAPDGRDRRRASWMSSSATQGRARLGGSRRCSCERGDRRRRGRGATVRIRRRCPSMTARSQASRTLWPMENLDHTALVVDELVRVLEPDGVLFGVGSAAGRGARHADIAVDARRGVRCRSPAVRRSRAAGGNGEDRRRRAPGHRTATLAHRGCVAGATSAAARHLPARVQAT